MEIRQVKDIIHYSIHNKGQGHFLPVYWGTEKGQGLEIRQVKDIIHFTGPRTGTLFTCILGDRRRTGAGN